MVGGNAALPVVISGDREVRYDAILGVMDQLQQQGVAARRPDGQAAPELTTAVRCSRPRRRRAAMPTPSRMRSTPEWRRATTPGARRRQAARPWPAAVHARAGGAPGLFAFLFIGIRWQKTTPIAQAELWVPSMVMETRRRRSLRRHAAAAAEPPPPEPPPPPSRR